MIIHSILRKIYRYFVKPSANYPKGMNSIVDSLSDLVIIGERFISAPGSIILAHDASLITHIGKTRIEKTIIEDDVFVGANAVILAGAKIGKGSIIGAGAIVSKEIPPYSVVAGNPGRVIMSVDEYIKKCEKRDILYSLPVDVLEKHGTGERFTDEQLARMNTSIYNQYKERNSK